MRVGHFDAEELLAEGTIGVQDAVAFTGLSRAELYRRMADGDLAFATHGRRRLIPRRALVAMLASGLRGAVPRDAA